MNEWKTATVSELQGKHILLVEDGNHGEYRPRPNEFMDYGVSFIRAADIDEDYVFFESASKISDNARKRITKGIGAPGDVLLTHKGTVGRVALVPDNAPPFVCSPQTTFWRTLNGDVLDRKYLYVFLKSPAFQAQLATREAETDMAPYVSLTSQRGLRLSLPSIQEQRKIASYIFALIDKVKVNHQINRILEAIGQALFKRWFVDFEFPNQESKPYKSNGGEMVGHPEWTEPIPKGWKVLTLDACFDFLEGPGIRNWQYTTEGIPFINIRLIKNGDIDIKQASYISLEEVNQRYSHFLLKENDIIVSTSGTLGRFALVRKTHLPLLLNTSVIKFRPKENSAYAFMYFYLTSSFFQSELKKHASGSVQLNFGPSHLKKIKILLPPCDILKLFSQRTEGFIEKTISNRNQSDVLNKIRDTLLAQIMSGKIRVPLNKEPEK